MTQVLIFDDTFGTARYNPDLSLSSRRSLVIPVLRDNNNNTLNSTCIEDIENRLPIATTNMHINLFRNTSPSSSSSSSSSSFSSSSSSSSSSSFSFSPTLNSGGNGSDAIGVSNGFSSNNPQVIFLLSKNDDNNNNNYLPHHNPNVIYASGSGHDIRLMNGLETTISGLVVHNNGNPINEHEMTYILCPQPTTATLTAATAAAAASFGHKNTNTSWTIGTNDNSQIKNIPENHRNDITSLLLNKEDKNMTGLVSCLCPCNNDNNNHQGRPCVSNGGVRMIHSNINTCKPELSPFIPLSTSRPTPAIFRKESSHYVINQPFASWSASKPILLTKKSEMCNDANGLFDDSWKARVLQSSMYIVKDKEQEEKGKEQVKEKKEEAETPDKAKSTPLESMAHKSRVSLAYIGPPTATSTGHRVIKRHCHVNEKIYACQICGKKYKYETNLITHAKVHTEDALECGFCHKKFGRKTNYIEHLRIHTNERPYQCRYCGKSFKQNHGWRDHERTHTNERPHVCDVCGKGFTVGHNLTVHKRIHTGEKPYQCDCCEKKFRQKSAYNAHMKNVHKYCKVKVD